MKNGLSKRRFEEIFQEGKRANGEFCRLMALPGMGRFGIATPKKLGSTPRRNRLKRRYRAAVSKCERPLDLDLVIAIAVRAETAAFSEIYSDLQTTLKRIRERWASESASS